VAKYFVGSGHYVIILSSGPEGEEEIDGIRVVRIKRMFTTFVGETREFKRIVRVENPDKIVMLLGMSSFLRFDFDIGKPTIGILTSPIYSARELIQNVGIVDTLNNTGLMAIHLINALIPSFVIKHWGKRFDNIVVLSEWNKQRIILKGISKDKITIIPPGLDRFWVNTKNTNNLNELKASSSTPKIVYFTSPLCLRGTLDLIRAFSLVVRKHNAQLIFICRIDSEDSQKQIEELQSLAKVEGVIDRVEFIGKNLDTHELKAELMKATLVCIPFKIVISDVPLSLLEAMALGIPILSTNVSSIPDFVKGAGFCVTPNNPRELSEAISMLLNDNDLLLRLGKTGRDLMINYPSWENVGMCHESIIQGIDHN